MGMLFRGGKGGGKLKGSRRMMESHVDIEGIIFV